jgi:hypothetical protein
MAETELTRSGDALSGSGDIRHIGSRGETQIEADGTSVETAVDAVTIACGTRSSAYQS